MALPKKSRITSSKEIQSVLKYGFKLNTKNTRLIINKNRIEHNKYLVIVSKKINKRAVYRNKIKRKILQMLYTRGLLENLENNFDIIIQVKNTMMYKIANQEILEDLESSLINFKNKTNKNIQFRPMPR